MIFLNNCKTFIAKSIGINLGNVEIFIKRSIFVENGYFYYMHVEYNHQYWFFSVKYNIWVSFLANDTTEINTLRLGDAYPGNVKPPLLLLGHI